MKKLSAQKLYDLFAAVAAKQTLYIPVDEQTGAVFKKYEQGVKLSCATNTVRSAKDFFFPQTENLMDFKMEGKHIEVIDSREECEDFVLFGVRACDAASFEILDRVYLHADPVDTYYKNRREHGTVVTLACSAPDETCFCKTFGIDAANPAGDVTVWEVEGGYALRANTQKGESFLSENEALFEQGNEAEVAAAQEKTRAILAKLPLADLTAEGFGGGLTKEFFNRPEWATLSEACLGCGTCTFVCPTCQCYDIRDFDTGHGIKRFRCWDSCMYSDFTKMAHGNSRVSQVERFRQRFMHKLVYFPENNEGVFGCVGCGRCLARCPISMNIVKVMKTLGGKKA